LESLSGFLAGLNIEKNGRAMIVGSQGRVIAYPRKRIFKHYDSGLMTARVDEIGDDAAAGAYDRFRIDGPGRETITVNGKRYLAALSPLQGLGRDWSVMIVVPENDFIGFVERSNRTGLVMSLAIVAVAAIGAVLLAQQGLRGDRVVRIMAERGRAMARQGAALDRLADEGLFDPARNRPPDALTETAANLTGARRAGLWYFRQNGALLQCVDRYDADIAVHFGGIEIERGELPQFFQHLAEGAEINVANGASDPRTVELHRLILAPLGTRSLVVIPVRRYNHAVGSIWLEDPVDTSGSRNFLRALASIAAFRVNEVPGETEPQQAVSAFVSDEPAQVRSHSGDLARPGHDGIASDDALFPAVCVLVIRIAGPVTATNGVKEPQLLDAVVRAVQEAAAEQEIPYLKLVGSEIVGAAGFAHDDPTAAGRVANAAVASRERISQLCEASGLVQDFGIGIDSGSAIGRSVGSDPSVFNLWGEAVQTAEIMAASALPGTIQTSEGAYSRLHHSFLFRPRGTFYLPAVGAAKTFLLAGRL
jgi:adenylate cyclase